MRRPAVRRGRGRRRRRAHVLAELRGADHEARGADRHGPLADAPVGGLEQRPVEQLLRAAEHQLVQVEGPDDRRQRGPELLADAAEDLGRALPVAAPSSRRRRRWGTARIVSRQPVREQAQRSPSGSTTTWPISPAAPRWPCSSEPPSTRPAPTPVPTRSTIRPPSPEAPKVCSPRTAVLASFATKTGTPSASARLAASGVSVQARLGASMTVPAASTTPGLPTPMPSTGRSVIAISAAASRCTSATAASPTAPSSGSSWRACTWPARLMTAPVIRSVADRSMPMMWVGVGGQPDQRRRLADPAPGRSAELLDQPVGDQLADQVGDGDPGQPAGAGQVGAARRALPEELLEQQRPVVATGVLLEELAAGPELPAHRRGRVTFVSSAHLHIPQAFRGNSPDCRRRRPVRLVPWPSAPRPHPGHVGRRPRR